MTTHGMPHNESHNTPCSRRVAKRYQSRREGFALIEALLSLTILAIAGTVMMRSFQNAVDTTGRVREIADIVYLTEKKLHELELEYDGRPLREARLGELRGTYTEDGVHDYVWRADVVFDEKSYAYVITLTTLPYQGLGRRRSRNFRNNSYDGFTLKTIVPTARINEVLLFGGEPSRVSSREQGRADRRSSRADRGRRGGGGGAR